MRSKLGWLWLLLIGNATSAVAQGNAVSSGPILSPEAERADALVPPEDDPRTGILGGSSVGLRASNDNSEVILTLAPQRNDLLTTSGQTSWSVTFKAPIDKASGSGVFVTEQGLVDKFASEFSLTRILTQLGPSDDQAVLAAQTAYVQRCIKDCWRGDLAGAPAGELEKYLTPAEIAAIKGEEVAAARRPIWIINATGSLGYGRYTYFSPATFEKSKDNKLSYAVSVSAGVNPAKGAPFLGLGYEYKREFEAQDKRVVCPASAAPPATTECEYKVFDAPGKNISHSAFALVRVADLFHAVRKERGFRLPAAFEVKAAYDIHDKIFGLTAPVYFLLDEDGGFRGGTKFSWADGTAESNKDEFKVSVFVVKSFDFFGL